MNIKNTSFAAHLLITLAAFAFVAPAAYADAESVVADGSVRTIGALFDNDFLTTSVQPRRSYCCTIYDQKGIEHVRFGDFESEMYIENIAERGLDEPVVPTRSDHTAPERTRLCFTTKTEFSVASVSIYMLVSETGMGGGPVNNVDVSCQETTLSGGFNTVVTDFNFLELRNTQSPNGGTSSVDMNLVAQNSITDVTYTPAPFALDAGKRRDINIHELVGNPGFGPVSISHNGAPGSIRAINAQYRIVTVEPLDFTPVASEELKTRSQIQ